MSKWDDLLRLHEWFLMKDICRRQNADAYVLCDGQTARTALG